MNRYRPWVQIRQLQPLEEDEEILEGAREIQRENTLYKLRYYESISQQELGLRSAYHKQISPASSMRMTFGCQLFSDS